MEVVSNMIPQALVVYIYNENWNNTTLLIIVKKIHFCWLTKYLQHVKHYLSFKKAVSYAMIYQIY